VVQTGKKGPKSGRSTPGGNHALVESPYCILASNKIGILLGSLLSCSNGMLSFFRSQCPVAGQGRQQLLSPSARLLSQTEIGVHQAETCSV